MALIERLMGLADDGTTPDATRKIHTHLFFGVNHQRVEGQMTRAQVIAALGLTGDQVTEYDALAALAPTGTTAIDVARKAMFLEGIHSALICAESRVEGYDTPAELRAKLGL